jgi:hypothetical protein
VSIARLGSKRNSVDHHDTRRPHGGQHRLRLGSTAPSAQSTCSRGRGGDGIGRVAGGVATDTTQVR